MGRSSSLDGGTVDHSDLEKRDIADQHTTSSVTGLDQIIADSSSSVDDKRERQAGFFDRDEVTLDFDFATGIVSVIPVGTDFTIWTDGIKFVFTTTQTYTVPKDFLLRTVYFDSAGDLQSNVFPSPSDQQLTTKATVCSISTNVNDSKYNQIYDLRYTTDMAPTTRKNFLNHHGVNYNEGFELQDMTLDGDGSLDDHTQFSVTDGNVNLADIYHSSADDSQSLVFPANVLMYYLEDTSWKVKLLDEFPFIGTGQVPGYDDVRLPYNPQNNLGEGQLVECKNGWYVNIHYFATVGLDNSVIGLMGMREYPTLDNARNGGQNELQGLYNIPYWFLFTTCIGSVIYQTSDDYTNTGHARIVTNDIGTDYIDNRGAKDDIVTSNNIVPSFKDTEFNLFNQNEYNFKFSLDAIDPQITPEVIWTPSEDNIDFRTVPQYKLIVKAASPLTQYDDISLNINGDAQKYPATGGESTTEFTTRAVVDSTMVYLSGGTGVVAFKEETTNDVYLRAGTADGVGGVNWGTEVLLTDLGGTECIEMNACSIGTYYGSFSFVMSNGQWFNRVIYVTGTNAIQLSTQIQVLGTSVESADIVWNPTDSEIVTCMCYNGGMVYSGSIYLSNNTQTVQAWSNLSGMPASIQCQIAYNYRDACIQTIAADGNVYWIEAYRYKPYSWSDPAYNDVTNARNVITGAKELAGVEAYNYTMFGQVKMANDTWQTFYAQFSAGSSMNVASTYGAALSGKKAFLYKSTSGIGYTAVVNASDNLEIWEGSYSNLGGGFSKIYTSTFTMVSTTHKKMTALLFEAAHAIMGVGDISASRDLFIVDSNITRTDNYIGNALTTTNMGDDVEILLGLPIISHSLNYSPGTIFFFGPYKYQVVTRHQMVIILEEVTPI